MRRRTNNEVNERSNAVAKSDEDFELEAKLNAKSKAAGGRIVAQVFNLISLTLALWFLYHFYTHFLLPSSSGSDHDDGHHLDGDASRNPEKTGIDLANLGEVGSGKSLDEILAEQGIKKTMKQAVMGGGESKEASKNEEVKQEDAAAPEAPEGSYTVQGGHAQTDDEPKAEMPKAGEIPALPDKGGEATTGTEEERTQVLTVDGEKVKLDKLGPVVLNTDGSMSRITNWHTMTEAEQANTWRIISKRNEKRRKELLAQGKETSVTVGV